MSAPKRVGVLGVGTMGPGIALAFALGGWDVDVIARSEESISPAKRRIETSLERIVESGRTDSANSKAARDRIAWQAGLTGGGGWNLVVESITEDFEAKRTLFAQLEDLVAPETILTTNTSSLSIDQLGATLRHPQRALGLHWLNPPEFVDLVEVIVGEQTDGAVTSKVINWMRELGKTPVEVSHDTPGFIVNRLQYSLLREAFALVETGVASFEDIDAAITSGLGARWSVVGPFEGLDLGGLDVYTAVAPRLYPALSCTQEPAQTAIELVASGATGCKTGRGTRGSYEPEDAAALVKRRDAMLLELSRLRNA